MQEEILTLQLGSFANNVMNHFWEIEQLNFLESIKTNPDLQLNSTFMRGDPKRPRTIIFDMKENLEKYDFYQGNTNPESEKIKFKHWDQQKIQVFNLKEEEKVDPTAEKSGSLSKFALTERNFSRVPSVDNYFNNYLHGRHILASTEQTDNIEEKIRYFLEESDHLRGFQFFLDTNSGYGSINKYILEYLSEECPKRPIFQYSFDNWHYVFNKDNEKLLGSLRYLNKLVNMYELKEYASWYLPIDVENILQLQGLNPAILASAPEKAYNLLALIISNISLPYRFTNRLETADSIKSFTEHLLPYPELNIFNACFHIKGFPQAIGVSDQTELEKYHSIFNYKDYKPRCLFPLPNKEKLKNYTTFAEDYVLRGQLEGVKIPKEFTSAAYNYHLQETEVLLTEGITELLDPMILNTFGSIPQGPHAPSIQKLPFYSCVFTSEILKFYMEDIVKDYKKIEKSTKLQFIKEDYTEDEFKEMENFFMSLRDSYDNSRDDEGDDDDGDDV